MNPSEQTQPTTPSEAVDQSTVQAAENVVNEANMGEVSVTPQNIDTTPSAPEVAPQTPTVEAPAPAAPSVEPEVSPAPVAGQNVPLTTEQVAAIPNPNNVIGMNQDGMKQWNEARDAVAAAAAQAPEQAQPAPANQVSAPPVVEQPAESPAQPESSPTAPPAVPPTAAA